MGKKKNKLKKLIDTVDCIIENDEFLLSRRMGISKSIDEITTYLNNEIKKNNFCLAFSKYLLENIAYSPAKHTIKNKN